MRVLFALCAQSATVDRSTNRLSIFNVIDHLPVSSFPLNIPSIAFVTTVESDHDQVNNSISGIAEIIANGQSIFRFAVAITFTDNQLARTVLNFQGIPVKEPGFLTFRLSLPDGTVADTTFQVSSVVSQVVPSTNPPPVSA
jgi:hypothetical protein